MSPFQWSFAPQGRKAFAVGAPSPRVHHSLNPDRNRMVLTLSTLGVIISALVVTAGMMHFLAWPAAPALIFSVLIAATDPIAVIAMFKDTGIKGRLRLLVESESLLNDGVAAVLFALALTWAQDVMGSSARNRSRRDRHLVAIMSPDPNHGGKRRGDNDGGCGLQRAVIQIAVAEKAKHS
jgi:Sodium/hydrogen exchanger family